MADTLRARQVRSSGTRTKMIRLASLVLAVSVFATISVMLGPVARLDAPDAFAIRNAQIVTGSGQTIAKGNVVFRKGLITDVGENAKIPADARVIDGTGMTVYPGLIDGYTSL